MNEVERDIIISMIVTLLTEIALAERITWHDDRGHINNEIVKISWFAHHRKEEYAAAMQKVSELLPKKEVSR